MEKLLLIDGNSLIFRAYYATMGRPMTTSFGKSTNAVFGFANMIKKAMDSFKPDYVLVAFDTGEKTFRHKQYPAYKGTRKELAEELIQQFPICREFLDAYPLKRLEVVGYEADDIIGTFVKNNPDVTIEILSSDRDLLQLITDHASVILMKSGISEFDVMDEAALWQRYSLKPRQIIDLKSLMGDASDNIPGVKSVGEKTAVKLLTAYQTLDGVYAHLDEIKGKLHEKLVEHKADAYLSYELATIIQTVPVNLPMDYFKADFDAESLSSFYRKYEMNALNQSLQTKIIKKETTQQVNDFSADVFNDSFIIVVDTARDQGFNTIISGFALSDGLHDYYVENKAGSQLTAFNQFLESPYSKRCVYAKLLYHHGLRHHLTLQNLGDDLLITAFVADSSLTSLPKVLDKYGLFHADLSGRDAAIVLAQEARPLFDTLANTLELQDELALYETIEKPLTQILAMCEYEGFDVDRDVLQAIAEKTNERLESLTSAIYECVGFQFNINSPKQLGDVLYDHLGMKGGRKRSTAVDTLEGLIDQHPVIALILDYRKYAKLYSTYALGLQKSIQDDGKIHTVLNQNATQTGRLSSSDPNLQNISVRNEETKEIRKAFIAPADHVLLSVDYSQIELRMLAHLADEPTLIAAFREGRDIHTQTAVDLFNVEADAVTPLMRRQAKTVNFGIIYGISEYGLSQQLGIEPSVAKEYIATYLHHYGQIHQYMQDTIQFCQDHGYVKTMFGRRREIPEIYDKNYANREFGKRAAMNAPIQGSAADLIKKAMILVDKSCRAAHMTSKMILQVHDELIFVVPHGELEEMTRLIVDGMTHAVELKVPLEVSVSSGVNWYEAK